MHSVMIAWIAKLLRMSNDNKGEVRTNLKVT